MALPPCSRDTLRDVVAALCACVNFTAALTLVVSLNTLFPDWLDAFDASRAATAAVQSTCFGVTLGGAVIAGMLERKLGARMCLLSGTLLASGGLLSGGFATNLASLIVCVGLVTGSGFSLVHLSSLSVAMKRFPRKAGFMSAAMATSAGIAHLGTPVLYRYLSDEFTWRGTLMLTSGIMLHTAITSLLITSPLLQTSDPAQTQQSLSENSKAGRFRLSKKDGHYQASQTVVNSESSTYFVYENLSASNLHLEENGKETVSRRPEENSIKRKENIPNNHTNEESESKLKDSSLSIVSTDNLEIIELKDSKAFQSNSNKKPQNTHTDNELPHIRNNNVRKRDTRLSGIKSSLSFFSKSAFVAVLFASPLTLSSVMSHLFLLMDFTSNRKWAERDGLLLNFICMFVALVAQMAVGVASLHPRVRVTALMIFCGVVGSLGVSLLGQTYSFPLACALLGCLGVGRAVVGLFPAAILDATGPGFYSLALGVVCTVEGILETVGGILAGHMVDVLASYSLLSLVYGMTALAANLCLLAVFLTNSLRHRGSVNLTADISVQKRTETTF